MKNSIRLLVLLSFTLMIMFAPMVSNTAYADDRLEVQYHVKYNPVKVGDRISDISFISSDCSVELEGSGLSTTIYGAPTIIEAYPYNTDGIYNDQRLDLNQKLDLYGLYILTLRFDLSGATGSDDAILSTYIDSYPNLNSWAFNKSSSHSWGNITVACDSYVKRNIYKYLLVKDFKYSGNQKYVDIEMPLYPQDVITDDKIENVTLVNCTNKQLVFKLEGNDIPDYISAEIVQDNIADYATFQPLTGTMFYSYEQDNITLYEPNTMVNIENYGSVSTSLDRKTAYLTLQYEEGFTIPYSQDCSMVLSFRQHNSISDVLEPVEKVFHFTTKAQKDEKDVVLGTFKIFNKDNIVQIYSSIGKYFTADGFGIENAGEMGDFLFAQLENTEDTFDRTKEDIYINGMKAEVYIEDEEELYQDAIMNGKLAIQIADEYSNMGYKLDFGPSEEVSKDNNYTYKTKDKNLFISNYDYQWYKAVETTPINEVEICVSNQEGGKSTDILKYDDDEKYFILRGANIASTSKESLYSDYDVVAQLNGDDKYQLDIILSSDYFQLGDEIEIYLDGDDCTAKKTAPTVSDLKVNDDGDRIYFTLEESDLVANKIYITIESYDPFVLDEVDLENSGMGYIILPGETSASLKHPVNGQKYSFGISALDGIVLDYRSPAFTVEVPESTSSGSKTYKAKDEDKTAEKISGSGKKGSKRTITPIEGKKVGRVVVTDKDGNKVDVTKNEDGTYSFIQPASNVNVEVNYVNREITLNIGSTEAEVDGEKSNLDVCPVIRNDRTMLPIRFVAENLGAKVEWSEKNPNYVVITRGDTKIEITLGSDKMLVNGKEVKLDSVAFAENDRTYLPVRAVSENLNAIVEWNEAKPMEVKIYER